MKLQARFVQLPVLFDAERLAAEIEAVGEGAWRPHPENFAGNDFLPLISRDGDPGNEAFSGPMRPTPHLERCSYLVDVLATLGASLGRTRLMRLSGHAEVTPHVDINYYWRDRMRVHVPVVTQPTVSFYCAGQQVHMGAGECWIFDTWSRHRVVNDAQRSRIHLVADTVGGEGFWDLILRARAPGEGEARAWAPRKIAPFGAGLGALSLEQENLPAVMTPWEIGSHIDFLLSEAVPNAPGFQQLLQAAARFRHVWRGLWSSHGADRGGWAHYRRALEEFKRDLKAAGAERAALRNGADLWSTLNALVIFPALADVERETGAGEQRIDVAARAETPQTAAPRRGGVSFDRPVFIVNPPRSGSTLLFETLAQAPDVFTVGGESHGVIEGVKGLDPASVAFASNCLTAAEATPEVAQELRARFAQELRDRSGAQPALDRVRMLEKTPKNALRVPFLASVFPDARFIYLYRDPREVLASMMEGWESGRFVTYPTLPGWTGPWSFLLTPGWRELAGLPLHERVARQWAQATGVLLDALEALAPARWTVARYDALLAEPRAEVDRLCAFAGFGWDVELGATLPVARHTVSQPRADKWRDREGEINAVWPAIEAAVERAARAAAR